MFILSFLFPFSKQTWDDRVIPPTWILFLLLINDIDVGSQSNSSSHCDKIHHQLTFQNPKATIFLQLVFFHLIFRCNIVFIFHYIIYQCLFLSIFFIMFNSFFLLLFSLNFFSFMYSYIPNLGYTYNLFPFLILLTLCVREIKNSKSNTAPFVNATTRLGPSGLKEKYYQPRFVMIFRFLLQRITQGNGTFPLLNIGQG